MVESITLGKIKEQQASRKRANTSDVESDGSDIDISSTDDEAETKDDDESDSEIINVDFDFFNANKDVDFHAFKTLLRQLLGKEESLKVQLSALADMVLEATATTTIKCDGPESDPYCILSFINYKENRESDFVQYLKKAHISLKSLIQTWDTMPNQKIALVLSERFINMPPEIVGPLYRITLEDVANSADEKSGSSDFSHYLIVSRKYEVNFDNDDDVSTVDNNLRSKRTKQTVQIDYFHPEDKFIEKHAKASFSGNSNKGIIPTYTLIDHQGLVKAIEEFEAEVSTW